MSTSTPRRVLIEDVPSLEMLKTVSALSSPNNGPELEAQEIEPGKVWWYIWRDGVHDARAYEITEDKEAATLRLYPLQRGSASADEAHVMNRVLRQHGVTAKEIEEAERVS